MADVIVNAEVRSNVGQLNQDLRQTQQEAISIKDAFGVASGSIAAVQGGMKLFGVESEKTQEAILKVQAAMSMNQGIQSLIKQKDTIMSIAGFIGKWTGATKVLTVAQKMLNIVMNANPIGLVIAGITALIGLGAAIVSFFKNNAAATKEETQALKDNYNEINRNIEQRDKQAEIDKKEEEHRLRMTELNGLSIREYYAEKEAIIQRDLERQRSHRDNAIMLQKEAQAKIDELKKNNDSDSEIVKAARKHRDQMIADRKEYQKKIEKLKEELRQADQDEEYDRAVRDRDNALKRVEFEKNQEKKRKDRALRIKKERIAANKQFLAQLRKMNQEAALVEIEDDQERELKKAEQERDNQLKALEKSKVGDKVRAAMKEAIELEHQNKMKEINKKFEDEAKEKREQEDALLQEMINENNDALIENEVDQQLKALERQKAADLEKLKLHANFNELKIELDKKYDREVKKIQDEQVENDKKAKKDLVNISLKSSADLMKQASEFAGDNKELAAGSSLINTYQAVTKTLADGGGSPLSYLMAAGVLAAGLKSVQSIYDTDVGSGGGGSTPPAEVTPAPQMVSGSFDLTNVQQPEPLKAFVVTDEMTNSQDQLANIRRRATI
jgi:hypothetical protein